MTVQEIYSEFKATAEDIKGELMAAQANPLANEGFAIIKTQFNNYTVYIFDSVLRPSPTYPIRTYSHYNEAQAAFAMLRYDSLPYIEYPF